MSGRLSSLLFTIVAACSNSGTASPDARPYDAAGPCWFEGTTPAGTIVLGMGESEYAPLADDLPVVYGPQGGFHMPLHAKITSLSPGNPAAPSDPSNPRTRFSAWFTDTGEAISEPACGVRLGYKESADGYVLATNWNVLFSTLLRTEEVFDRQVRVRVEVIDENLNYAKDERVITCRKPVDW